MDTKNLPTPATPIRAKHLKSKHTYEIFDGAGYGLATITFRNMTRSAATNEATKIAKFLSPGYWSVSYAEPASPAMKFIADHVEVQS